MFSSIPPKNPYKGIENLSSSSTSFTDNAEVSSVDLNNADTQAASRAASTPAQERSVYAKRHWTIPLAKSVERSREVHQSQSSSLDKQTLTDNLKKYLRVGSNDSLHIMQGIFSFHQYDTTLLNRYINNRTQSNLKALETQIDNRLFLVGDKDNMPGQRGT